MEFSKSGPREKPPTGTIFAYRLVAPQWASTALSGEGARKFGGRWNSAGHPVTYLGESRALTALELLVHLTTHASRRKTYTLLEVKFPAASVSRAVVSAPDWNASPPTSGSTQVGDEWLQEGSSLALLVPSTLVREESVILLNPEHPDFETVEIVAQREFRFDERFEIDSPKNP